MQQSTCWDLTQRNRISRRTVLKMGLVGGVGVAMTSLVGCSGNSTTGAATGQPSATNTAGTIQRGGELRLATPLDAGTLDPHVSRSGGDPPFTLPMFDALIAYDDKMADRPEASLAEKWEFPDPKTVMIYLRKGITFHDGTPFNAQAVKFCIERVQDPKTQAVGRVYLQVISAITVVDDYTVKLSLSEPYAPLIRALGGAGLIQSPTAIQKWGADYGVHPVGTGPFSLVEWVKGSHALYKRNENYWGKDKYGNQLPYIDRVKVLVIPDSTVAMANLQTGDVDIINNVYPADLAKIKGMKNIAILDFPGGIASALIFNLKKPPMDDKNLRLAVAYAINPEAINQTVFYGDYIVSKAGLYPPGTWMYDDSISRPTYDPKKAKEYLAKAGKPNGFSMSMVTYSSPAVVQTTEMVKAQLAEVGIDVTIEVREVSIASTSFYQDNLFPVFQTEWGWTPMSDPDFARSTLMSDGFYNPGKVKNEELDSLIVKGAATYDQQERKKIYSRIMEMQLNEPMFLPLLYSRQHTAYNTRLQNLRPVMYSGNGYREIWIKQ